MSDIINDYLKSFKMRSKNCFYNCEHDPSKIALGVNAVFMYLPIWLIILEVINQRF